MRSCEFADSKGLCERAGSGSEYRVDTRKTCAHPGKFLQGFTAGVLVLSRMGLGGADLDIGSRVLQAAVSLCYPRRHEKLTRARQNADSACDDLVP